MVNVFLENSSMMFPLIPIVWIKRMSLVFPSLLTLCSRDAAFRCNEQTCLARQEQFPCGADGTCSLKIDFTCQNGRDNVRGGRSVFERRVVCDGFRRIRRGWLVRTLLSGLGHLSEGGLSTKHRHVSLTPLPSVTRFDQLTLNSTLVERVNELFRPCLILSSDAHSSSWQQWTMYSCVNCSKLISPDRLIDGTRDCFWNADEAFDGSCSSLPDDEDRVECFVQGQRRCL